MNKSSIPASSYGLQVIDAPTPNGTRMVLVGKKGPLFDVAPTAPAERPDCPDCDGFDTVVTRRGIAVCANPLHHADRPALPMRPTPHERDGRTESPQPVRPHALTAA
ncbi:hypothetical protein [Streptomyces sp. BH105]|uniref:hypothetical protein n=1 Tax=Streptomyces sp. BH105 TaxID=3410408 RepID=UPI003CFB0A47